MFKKASHLSLCMIMCMLLAVLASSCSKDDDKDEPKSTETTKPGQSNPIVGTWVNNVDNGTSFDNYTLVFQSNGTGSIRNDYGFRASITEQMSFNWSLSQTAYGYYMLSVIYISGDKMDWGPFSGDYVQWNRTVTIAGSTLSISTGDNTVMLFTRAK